ncbi:MBL fold metallo-hydrolase [Glutamicibacter protophormiae]|uniref:Glyoxylase-like metal-dependent hydrolase (Beta-lactamase superfamily II) n=1 Tax=Glutamicibacter protophormiae TaxID=37930 RepID=A0ABS4XTC2_GLUPR|nr:MBL fold metallo-hydrolase [Glutamicibacter protophormiae]MBP2399766.1 glyoxylase-like metal-dependent hydrolase (beta-lactamase superfamily II) [Glutamicibacter protophormiae]GGL89039.1 hydrolase [Glutamicibacter protophormiae]
MTARIENIVTSGTFSLDGGTWEVDNNVWLVGDDAEVIVIDPAHDPQAIRQAIGQREVMAVLLTHGHDDHIRAAAQFSDEVDAPLFLNPEDQMLWDAVYPERDIDAEIHEGDSFTVAGTTLTALHTPGHSPGSTCFYSEDLGVLFSGDTLFNGGPGATGRSYSSFETIIDSIRSKLLTLPAETVVNTGHGAATTIGDEAPNLDEWIARGH